MKVKKNVKIEKFILKTKACGSFSSASMERAPQNYPKNCINPRLTKGGWLQPPLTVFSRSLQNAKESDLGHISNLFYILCGHFDEKKLGVPPYPGVG